MPKIDWDKLNEQPFTSRQSEAIYNLTEYVDGLLIYTNSKSKLRKLIVELVDAMWEDVTMEELDAELDVRILAEVVTIRKLVEECSGHIVPKAVEPIAVEPIAAIETPSDVAVAAATEELKSEVMEAIESAPLAETVAETKPPQKLELSIKSSRESDPRYPGEARIYTMSDGTIITVTPTVNVFGEGAFEASDDEREGKPRNTPELAIADYLRRVRNARLVK